MFNRVALALLVIAPMAVVQGACGDKQWFGWGDDCPSGWKKVDEFVGVKYCMDIGNFDKSTHYYRISKYDSCKSGWVEYSGKNYKGCAKCNCNVQDWDFFSWQPMHKKFDYNCCGTRTCSSGESGCKSDSECAGTAVCQANGADQLSLSNGGPTNMGRCVTPGPCTARSGTGYTATGSTTVAFGSSYTYTTASDQWVCSGLTQTCTSSGNLGTPTCTACNQLFDPNCSKCGGRIDVGQGAACIQCNTAPNQFAMIDGCYDCSYKFGSHCQECTDTQCTKCSAGYDIVPGHWTTWKPEIGWYDPNTNSNLSGSGSWANACVPQLSCSPTKNQWDCCDNGNCGHMEGDCDYNDDCRSGHVCVHDVGAEVGANRWLDVCMKDCNHNGRANVDWSCCSVEQPCAEGHGDCDHDSECLGDLVCVHDAGISVTGAASHQFDFCARP